MKEFDFNTVEDFDRHIQLSIPNYDYLFSQVKLFTEAFSESGCPVVDVGCSTGKFIKSLDTDNICIGIDNSNLINDALSHTNRNKLFFKADFFDYEMPEDCSVITSMFFLQFLEYSERKKALDKMVMNLMDDGRLIVCEKTYFHDSRVEHIVNAHHLETKRENFTDTEILNKNIQLSNSMKLRSDAELIDELSAYGDVTVFFKSLGFTGCIVRVC